MDAEERRGDRRIPGARTAEARVRIASAVTQEMLLDLFPDALRYDEALSWNAQAERVEATERLLYEDLVLEESRAPRADPEAVAARLADEALSRGARSFAEEGAVDRVVARLGFAAEHAPDGGLARPTEEDLAAALRELCAGRRSFAELREARSARARSSPGSSRGRGRRSSGSPRTASRSRAGAPRASTTRRGSRRGWRAASRTSSG